MNDMIRNMAKKTPYVYLDYNNGCIELKGTSYMEDTLGFYDPIMQWVYEYVKHPKDTTVYIDLEFFNTSSAKILLIIIKSLSKIQKAGYRLTVNWFYEDDDDEIRDSGMSFAIMSHMKFNMIKKSDSTMIDAPELGNANN